MYHREGFQNRSPTYLPAAPVKVEQIRQTLQNLARARDIDRPKERKLSGFFLLTFDFNFVVQPRLPPTVWWKKYLDDQQFQDGYMKSAELAKFFDSYTDQMRGILKEAGAKVVR